MIREIEGVILQDFTISKQGKEELRTQDMIDSAVGQKQADQDKNQHNPNVI